MASNRVILKSSPSLQSLKVGVFTRLTPILHPDYSHPLCEYYIYFPGTNLTSSIYPGSLPISTRLLDWPDDLKFRPLGHNLVALLCVKSDPCANLISAYNYCTTPEEQEIGNKAPTERPHWNSLHHLPPTAFLFGPSSPGDRKWPISPLEWSYFSQHFVSIQPNCRRRKTCLVSRSGLSTVACWFKSTRW